MESLTLNKPTRAKKPKRINVALGFKHHRKLKGFARRHRCNNQVAAEKAVDALLAAEEASQADS